MQHTLILVTGQHRSGTSAVAGCLEQLGVYLGSRLMPANEANPKGYFEDTRAVGIHDRLLGELGASWDRPEDVGKSWRATMAADVAVGSATGLLYEFSLSSKLFAIKDPRASLFVPLWQEACRRAEVRLTLLIPKRLNEASAMSLMRREGWSMDRAKGVVFGYQDAIDRVNPAIPQATIYFPEELCQTSCWERIARELGVELDTESGMPRVYKFFDCSLVHND